MKQYEKDGRPFVPPLHVGDHVVYNPTHEMLTAAGYTVREDSSGGAAKSKVYKFDKYKIVIALGDKWAQKKTELVTAGLYDMFMASPYLSTGDPFFKSVYDRLTPEEKSILHRQCRYMGGA